MASLMREFGGFRRSRVSKKVLGQLLLQPLVLNTWCYLLSATWTSESHTIVLRSSLTTHGPDRAQAYARPQFSHPLCARWCYADFQKFQNHLIIPLLELTAHLYLVIQSVIPFFHISSHPRPHSIKDSVFRTMNIFESPLFSSILYIHNTTKIQRAWWFNRKCGRIVNFGRIVRSEVQTRIYPGYHQALQVAYSHFYHRRRTMVSATKSVILSFSSRPDFYPSRAQPLFWLSGVLGETGS